MVDDDMAFKQLGPDHRAHRYTNLLYRVARLWATKPERSVVLGGYTGDPPVPGLDCALGQLRDLASTVAAMLKYEPDAVWSPPPNPPVGFDYYYDLSEDSAPSRDLTWLYASNERRPVRELALRLLKDLPRLLDGQQLTRPLTWDFVDTPARPSLRRGGNTVFLDLDALFRWPTPVLGSADGVMTRRADTLWATLASQDEALLEITLPLLHGRQGQGPRVFEESGFINSSAKTAAQVRGVALARALSDGRNLTEELRASEQRVRAQRSAVVDAVAVLSELIQLLRSWEDDAINAALVSAAATLRALEHMAKSATPSSGDPDELERFLAQLPSAVKAWRDAW